MDAAAPAAISWHTVWANVLFVGTPICALGAWGLRQLDRRRKQQETRTARLISAAVREATTAITLRLDRLDNRVAGQGRTLAEVQRRTGRVESRLMDRDP